MKDERLWLEIRTERSHTSYHHDYIRHDLGKDNLIYCQIKIKKESGELIDKIHTSPAPSPSISSLPTLNFTPSFPTPLPSLPPTPRDSGELGKNGNCNQSETL